MKTVTMVIPPLSPYHRPSGEVSIILLKVRVVLSGRAGMSVSWLVGISFSNIWLEGPIRGLGQKGEGKGKFS